MSTLNQDLRVSYVQADLVWEDPIANCAQLEESIQDLQGLTDIIILPEMFSTGFSMSAVGAEMASGPTVQWMKLQASRLQVMLIGSLKIKESGQYYNRLLAVHPSGQIDSYDKRHLFAFAGEDQHFTAGNKRLIASVKGWKINLQICYDLRFPVWLRNDPSDPYDILLVVASWPDKRALHWRTLVPARAIENQSYVIAVNRVGHDGNEVFHSGGSMCIGPNGNVFYYKPNDEDLYTFTISKEEIAKSRRIFPFLKDSDSFKLDI